MAIDQLNELKVQAEAFQPSNPREEKQKQDLLADINSKISNFQSLYYTVNRTIQIEEESKK